MPTDRIIQRLHQLHPKTIDLSLGRIRRLLAKLDHPENQLPPVVHIAGTNGKGSTLALLKAMLEAAGYITHRYVSPHLIRFHERIELAGAPIADDALEALLDRVERANGDAPITFFEVTTAAALLAFSEIPADVLLLETGLGGRLDATNVVKHPTLTLLSPISMDHASYLGPNLTAITFEKCGILKAGVPALVARQTEPAALRIRQEAAKRGAPLELQDRDWQVSGDSVRLAYEDRRERLDLPAPALPGRHQITNAGLAIAAARKLNWPGVNAASIASGLRNVRWPGRLQRLTSGLLVSRLRPDDELWVDGGHNPAAAEALAAFLANKAPKPTALIIGMLNSKDLAGFLGPLRSFQPQVVGLRIPDSETALDAETIVAEAVKLEFDAVGAADLLAALDRLATGPARRIAIVGSLHLAGAALAANAGETAPYGG